MQMNNHNMNDNNLFAFDDMPLRKHYTYADGFLIAVY